MKIYNYRILPIKGTLPNKGAPHSLEEANSIINDQNTRSFLTNCPVSQSETTIGKYVEPLLSPKNFRYDLANVPGALIRQNTVL